MAKISPFGLKAPWEKEKLLIMSNISFSHSVFKILIMQTPNNPGLIWGKVEHVPYTSASTTSTLTQSVIEQGIQLQ